MWLETPASQSLSTRLPPPQSSHCTYLLLLASNAHFHAQYQLAPISHSLVPTLVLTLVLTLALDHFQREIHFLPPLSQSESQYRSKAEKV